MKKNSEIYPADVGPGVSPMMEAFDCLSADKAVDVVLQHYNITKEMAMKENTNKTREPGWCHVWPDGGKDHLHINTRTDLIILQQDQGTWLVPCLARWRQRLPP